MGTGAAIAEYAPDIVSDDLNTAFVLCRDTDEA